MGKMLAVCALLWAGPAAAKGSAPSFQVIESGQTLDHACEANERVVVSGSGNRVTLTGECGKVAVMGSKNIVAVEASAKIAVMGTDNEVTWKRGVGGKGPDVSRMGTNNKVSKVD
jgi:DUF3060 family protein